MTNCCRQWEKNMTKGDKLYFATAVNTHSANHKTVQAHTDTIKMICFHSIRSLKDISDRCKTVDQQTTRNLSLKSNCSHTQHKTVLCPCCSGSEASTQQLGLHSLVARIIILDIFDICILRCVFSGQPAPQGEAKSAERTICSP